MRNYQEDCIYVDGEIIQTDYMDCPVEKAVDKLSALFAVCDGMGGLSHGDMASRFVCEKFRMMDVPFSKEEVIDALKKSSMILKVQVLSGTEPLLQEFI